jgi:hypothetical protein
MFDRSNDPLPRILGAMVPDEHAADHSVGADLGHAGHRRDLVVQRSGLLSVAFDARQQETQATRQFVGKNGRHVDTTLIVMLPRLASFCYGTIKAQCQLCDDKAPQ